MYIGIITEFIPVKIPQNILPIIKTTKLFRYTDKQQTPTAKIERKSEIIIIFLLLDFFNNKTKTMNDPKIANIGIITFRYIIY